MTFEEFFKKKKINLTTLQQAEANLFAEFKEHFELMGEKSFDHTKKYWFNKLRRQFPAPVEVKAEKVIIENPLAEQTVADTLADPAILNRPKVGFKPRFKAHDDVTEPAGQLETTFPAAKEKPESAETSIEETTAPASPKPGFTPRFKAGVTQAKLSEQSAEPKIEATKPQESAEPAKPKPAFTPRFKAGLTQAATETPAEQPKAEEKETEKPTTTPQPAKPGFTPRFKAGITKPAEPIPEPQQEAEKPAEATETPAKPKVGFTPRFKAGVTSSKPAEPIEEAKPEEELPKSDPGADQPDQSANPAPKIGFKPRFKPPQK